MNLILIGYGKMGKAVEKAATLRNHAITKIIEVGELEMLNKEQGDVAIEFTTPESAFQNIYRCIELEIPVVSGTTGWIEKKNEIDDFCQRKDGTFFYASNFSIGVNLFFKINSLVAGLLPEKDYEISIDETHHIHKKDAPSGTAITIARQIIDNHTRYNEWSLGQKKPRSIPIFSHREGEIPGTHEVTFRSPFDRISLAHEAFGREGFANGVISVAEWISGKKGVVSMDDFLNF